MYPVYAPEAMNSTTRRMARAAGAGRGSAPQRRARPPPPLPNAAARAGCARSASDQTADRRQTLVFLAQREDLLLELAERPGDVLERGQGALQQRATARAPDAAPPSRRELGAALAGDAVVVR